MNNNDLNMYELGKIYEVRTGDVIPNINQPRKFFGQDALDGLKQSIVSDGIINPITVTVRCDHLEIVSGERRWRAATEVGIEFIQVMVVDNDRATVISLTENLQREDLLPIEIAEGLLILKQEHNYTHGELAGIIGKSVPTVSEILKLNRLSDAIKSECLKSKKYVHSRLLEIAKVPDFQAMQRAFEAYQNELEGKVRKADRGHYHEKTDGLVGRIKGIATQINQIDLRLVKKNERDYLFDELAKLDSTIMKKFSAFSALDSSDYRSPEGNCCDDQVNIGDASAICINESVSEVGPKCIDESQEEYVNPSQEPPEIPEPHNTIVEVTP